MKGISKMDSINDKLNYSCDYLVGAHPRVLDALIRTNNFIEPGYGSDPISESAREKIRKECGAPDADVFFLAGGTQVNATAIDALLEQYQGVIAADSGHISTHEAGAIEAGGHKVIAVNGENGKISAGSIKDLAEAYYEDENLEHLVMPGLVYLSQPTESGTLYSLEELSAIRAVCDKYSLSLYIDGARLAYALACPENDVTLNDLAGLCDAFYIGGTKCGTLFGEALVIPKHGRVPHMFTIIKQHGALLAKGRAVGAQFDALFTDGIYHIIGRTAIEAADRIRSALKEKGYELAFGSPTNQIFIVITEEQRKRLEEKAILGFWENLPDGKVIMRIATSWATAKEDVDALIGIL